MNFGVYVVKRVGGTVKRSAEVCNILELDQEDIDKVLNEIRVLSSIRHPSIIMYYDSYVLETTGQLVMITEYCPNGNLHEYMDDLQSQFSKSKTMNLSYEENLIFTEKQTLKIFIQMILGLKELQRRGLVHKNINPTNLFVDEEGNIKFGDFTYSSWDKIKTKIPEREIFYTSPEQLKNQPVSIKGDIWSVGVILYEMAFGFKPFLSKDRKKLQEMIVSGKYTMPEEVTGLPMIKLIINACLKINPDQRPSLDELLRYPFLKEVMKENFERYPDLEIIEHDAHPVTVMKDIKFDKNDPKLKALNKTLSHIRQERILRVLKGKDNINEIPWPMPTKLVDQRSKTVDKVLGLPSIDKSEKLDLSSASVDKNLKQPIRTVQPLPPLMFEIRIFGNRKYIDIGLFREKLEKENRMKITNKVSKHRMLRVTPEKPLIMQGEFYGKKAEQLKWRLPLID